MFESHIKSNKIITLLKPFIAFITDLLTQVSASETAVCSCTSAFGHLNFCLVVLSKFILELNKVEIICINEMEYLLRWFDRQKCGKTTEEKEGSALNFLVNSC